MVKGFDPFAGVVVLEFEDTRFAGAEIVLRLDVEMGDFNEFMRAETFDQQVEWLATHDILRRWNIEHEGEAWPATGENLRRLPVAILRQIIEAYTREALGPGAPLEQRSGDGNTSPGQSTSTAKSSNRRKSTGQSA